MNSIIAGFWYSTLFSYKCTAQAPDVFLHVYIQLQQRNYFKQDLTLLISKKKIIYGVMCLEYMFGYFILNATF